MLRDPNWEVDRPNDGPFEEGGGRVYEAEEGRRKGGGAAGLGLLCGLRARLLCASAQVFVVCVLVCRDRNMLIDRSRAEDSLLRHRHGVGLDRRITS